MDWGTILYGKRLEPLADAVGAARQGERVVLRFGRYADARWMVQFVLFGHGAELTRRRGSLDAARWVFDHASGGKLEVRLARAPE